MPGRSHIFVEGEYYHIYNKAIDDKRPFISSRNSQTFLHMLWFYRASGVEISHSRFLELPPASQIWHIPTLNDPENSQVTLLAYCLMPTHYHILMREKKKGGISAYMSKVQNAFTRYYNIKSQRAGQVFRGHFKSRPITSEETLRHVARYIHLNPFSSNVIKSSQDLLSYPLSSMKELYADKELKPSLTTDTDLLLGFFGGHVDRYVKFVLDNADYQKTLEGIKKIEKTSKSRDNSI